MFPGKKENKMRFKHLVRVQELSDRSLLWNGCGAMWQDAHGRCVMIVPPPRVLNPKPVSVIDPAVLLHFWFFFQTDKLLWYASIFNIHNSRELISVAY